MPTLRDGLRPPQALPPDTAPDFLEILDRYGWHERAACRDADPRAFETDAGNLDRPSYIGMALLVEGLLYCAKCPVRVECLADAFADHSAKLRVRLPSGRDGITTIGAGATLGTWGGSTVADRAVALREAGGDPDEAQRLLHRTFEARLERHVAAYRARSAHPKGRAARRVDAMLGLETAIPPEIPPRGDVAAGPGHHERH